MGSGQSAATIVIALNQTTVNPGDQIQGKVYLDVRKDKIDGDSLVVRLVGAERTIVRWTTTSTDSEGRSTTHYHSTSQSCTFLDIPFVLSSVTNGYFTQGQYEFPFIFTLPKGGNISPSMSASIPGSEGGDCSISYSVEARLHRKGWFKWDVKNQVYLSVLPIPIPTDALSVPAYIPPQQQNVKFCCCYSRGDVILGMHTSSAFLYGGANVDINYIVQNNSHATIKAIEIGILENISWSANGRSRLLVNKLFYRRLEGNTLPNDLMIPLKHRADKSTTTIGDYISDLKTLNELKEILDSRKFSINGTLGNAVGSIQGSLITVSYNLTLKVCTTFGSSNPVINAPIWIFSAYSASSPPPALPIAGLVGDGAAVATPTSLPPDWHPVVATATVIPNAVYVQPVLCDSHESPLPQDIATAPSAPPVKDYNGSAALMRNLQNTYDQLDEFHQWIMKNSPDSLSPQDFEQLFRLLRASLDQMTIAQELEESRLSISCEHIAKAATSCSALVRTEIVKRLAKKCQDKENRALVEKALTPFDWLCVHSSFE